MKNHKKLTVSTDIENYPADEIVVNFFQKKNIRVNRSRIDVVQTLLIQDQPIGAEELWLTIYPSHKVSISAIYNTLNLLVRHGIVEKISAHRENNRYILHERWHEIDN